MGVPYEDAIALTGNGRFHLLLLLISGSTITCTTSEILGPSYLLPAAKCDLNMSDFDMGLLGAMVYIGMICGSHFWGYLADTRGRKNIIRLTLFADAAVALLAALSPNYTVLVTLKFFSGFFMTAPQAVAYAYLGEFHSPDNRARAFVWAGVFPAIGLLLLPGMGWLVLPQDWSVELPWPLALVGAARSWRLYVVLCGVPSLLTAVGFCFLPESPKYLLSRGRSEEALAVLRKVFRINTGRPEADFPVDELLPATSDSCVKQGGAPARADPKAGGFFGVAHAVWKQTGPLFAFEHLLSTFLSLFIMFGIIAGANGLPTWLPELFNRMALWEAKNPGQSASICDSVGGLQLQLQLLSDWARGTRAIPSNSTALHFLARAAGAGVRVPPSPSPLPPLCVAHVEEAVFTNNLYLGATALAAPVISVYFVVPLGKRTLLLLSLLLTGVCGVALDLVRSSTAFMVLSCVVVAVTEMCISLFSSVIVDMFPTHLRAMAVSLSLMCGRVGSIVGNFMFGALLETACPATFYALGGVLLACTALGFALPRRGRFGD